MRLEGLMHEDETDAMHPRTARVSNSRITWRKAAISGGLAMVAGALGWFASGWFASRFAEAQEWKLPVILMGILTIVVIIVLIVPAVMIQRYAAKNGCGPQSPDTDDAPSQ